MIVFDLYLPRPSAFDPVLASAMRDAHLAGARVVVGVKAYSAHAPGLAPALKDASPLWGGLGLGASAGGHWADLMIERDRTRMPSLSLAAFSAYCDPTTDHEYEAANGIIRVDHVRYVPNDREDEGHSLVATTGHKVHAGQSTMGIEAGDDVHFVQIKLPPSHVRDASTERYERVFEMDNDERARRFGSKIVVIGNVETDGYIPATLDEAESLGVERDRGMQVHAAAIQTLMFGVPSRLARWLNLPVAMLGAGIVLIGTGRRSGPAPRSLLRLGGAVVAGMLIVVVIAVVMRLENGLWLNVLAAVIAAGLAGALSLRGSHFIHPAN